MSSSTTELAAEEAVTVVETVEKAQHKFPTPCWTQEETLALIEAYRERWYALRRGYLRTADWEAVAATVASRCPGAYPAKTSSQCRHKMEKLRQRYRAEKQRALSFPYPASRSFSSWFFFENMEAMENGTTPPTSVEKPENSSDETRLKSVMDQHTLKLKLKEMNNSESSPDSGYDNCTIPKRFNSTTRTPIDYTSYTDTGKLEEEIAHENDLMNSGKRQKTAIGIPRPAFKSRSERSGKTFNNFDVASVIHQEILPPIRKFDPSEDSDNNKCDPNEEFWVRIPNTDYNSNNFRPNYWEPNSDSKGGLKRGRNSVEKIVESIKLLGEGFMKMEKEKMEMAREIEAERMEMEMKRNQMLLESQKQIVDTFLNGLCELKKRKKAKTGVVSADSAEL